MKKFLHNNYHWIIAAVTVFHLLVYGGAGNNFSGYHMIPVTETLGISRTAFSLVVSLKAIVSVTGTLLSGVLIRRFGYRKVATSGLLLMACCYLLMASAKSFGAFSVGCAVMGLSDGLCYTANVSRLVNGWFRKNRGLVLGLVTAATGVGSSLLGFIQLPAIEYVSWRLSFVLVAGLLGLVAVLVVCFVRNTPEDMGLAPFGADADTDDQAKNNQWAGFSMEQLKTRPAFYLMILCAFLTCLSVLLVSFNVTPYFQDRGMSATEAGSLYSTMMLLLGFVKLGMGFLCDRIGAKRGILLCQSACTLGIVLMLVLPFGESTMLLAVIVFALAMPVTTIMFPLLSVELFGYWSQSRYIGTVVAMVSVASVVSNPLANGVYDLTGSYMPIFGFAAGLSAVMLVRYGLLFVLVTRDKKKFFNAEGETL